MKIAHIKFGCFFMVMLCLVSCDVTTHVHSAIYPYRPRSYHPQIAVRATTKCHGSIGAVEVTVVNDGRADIDHACFPVDGACGYGGEDAYLKLPAPSIAWWRHDSSTVTLVTKDVPLQSAGQDILFVGDFFDKRTYGMCPVDNAGPLVNGCEFSALEFFIKCPPDLPVPCAMYDQRHSDGLGGDYLCGALSHWNRLGR